MTTMSEQTHGVNSVIATWDHQHEYKLQVHANINGASLDISGYSRGVPSSGEFLASVSTADPLPKSFDLSLLAFVLKTGSPSIALLVPGIENFFRKTGGVYTATRKLDLREHGHLTCDYRVERAGDTLASSFDLQGTVNVPELVSVEPTVETWIPNGPGRIAGNFVMSWLARDGSRVIGDGVTQYKLPTKSELSSVHFRDIRIKTVVLGGTLNQYESIVLFGPDQLAKRMRS
jgi:hypothetical protein